MEKVKDLAWLTTCAAVSTQSGAISVPEARNPEDRETPSIRPTLA
jgi:hypothetical protein